MNARSLACLQLALDLSLAGAVYSFRSLALFLATGDW